MDFKTYQEEAKKTAIYPERFEVIYPALGLASEVGEVTGKIKKIMRDKDGIFEPEDRNAVAAEIGDVIWYLAALCNDLELSLDAVAELNIEKLKSRLDRGVLRGSGDTR